LQLIAELADILELSGFSVLSGHPKLPEGVDFISLKTYINIISYLQGKYVLLLAALSPITDNFI
jgi:hypothetical protein